MATAVRDAGRPALRLDAAQRRLLLIVALGLWAAIYALLNVPWFTPPVEHQAERALRRIVTCGAGIGLCVAMVPVLARASLAPLRRRLLIALRASVAAWGAHLLVRLAVFHVYRPLWGPLDLEVVGEALGGAGWMFGLWAAVCLLVFAEARHAADEAPGPPREAAALPEAVWCTQGGRRVRVDLADVVLFAAERDYVRLHAAGRQHLVRGRLKDWCGMLPAERFMQVHRSAIVRLDAVRGLERAGSVWRLKLEGGTEALVSRAKGRELRQRLAMSS